MQEHMAASPGSASRVNRDALTTDSPERRVQGLLKPGTQGAQKMLVRLMREQAEPGSCSEHGVVIISC